MDTRYFKIIFGCGCGEVEEYIEAIDFEEAERIAEQEAIENYESYEGLHGVLSREEIADQLFGEGDGGMLSLDELTDEQIEEVEEEYQENIQSTIYYCAIEMSYENWCKERLEG